MQWTAFCTTLFLAAALLVGCGDNSPTTKPSSGGSGGNSGGSGSKPRIAVIPKGTTHEFWKSVHAGARKAESETRRGPNNEPTVSIVWQGPLKEDDSASQIKVVEDMINSNVAGIVLAPNDATALRGVVEKAANRRIPVVIIDSNINTDTFKSFVATDNKHGGYLGGKQLASALGGKGKVVMLRYQQGSASTDNREAGFLEAMKENPGIEVVSSSQYGGATSESAFTASQRLLAPYIVDGKLTVDGIFTPNESTTFGMLRTLQDKNLAGKVKFVGFDASEKLVAGLKAGEIDALVVQNPLNMGYMAVKTMIELIKENNVPPLIDTGVAVVTKENMDDPSVQDAIRPDLDKWLK